MVAPLPVFVNQLFVVVAVDLNQSAVAVNLLAHTQGRARASEGVTHEVTGVRIQSDGPLDQVFVQLCRVP